MQGLYRKALRYKGQCGIIKPVVLAPPVESVEKVDTLPHEDAVRSKIFDFQTALYPRQYHTCTLEKPLNKRFFAYKEFFRRACRRKNKNAAERRRKIKFEVYRQTETAVLAPPFFAFNQSFILF